MYDNFRAQRPKSDIVYYEAFKSCQTNTRYFLIFKALLASLMIILFIVNYLNQKLFEDLTRAILVNLVASIFGIALKLAEIKNIYSDNLVFLSLAEINSHAVVDELVYNFQRIEDCVSKTIFVASQNLNDSDLDAQTKTKYIRSAEVSFKKDISKRFRGIASAQRFHSTLSFTSIIYSIIILCQNDLSSLSVTMLSIYVTIVGLSEFVLLIGVIVVAFIPLLCIFYCVIIWCKKNRKGIVDLEIKKATMEEIIRVDGDCAICYQSFAQSEEIYVLPCSDKHIFHKGCLEQWAKVRENCPICRGPIPMRGHP